MIEQVMINVRSMALYIRWDFSLLLKKLMKNSVIMPNKRMAIDSRNSKEVIGLFVLIAGSVFTSWSLPAVFGVPAGVSGILDFTFWPGGGLMKEVSALAPWLSCAWVKDGIK